MTIAHAILLFGVGPVLVAERPLAGRLRRGRRRLRPAHRLLGRRRHPRLAADEVARCSTSAISELLVLGGTRHGRRPGSGRGVAPTFTLALAGMVAGGSANGLFSVAAEMLVQDAGLDGVRSWRDRRAPDDRDGRVHAPRSPRATPIVAWLGPQPVYAVAAAGCAGSAAMLLTLPVETRQTAPATTPA